jgi:hypothetical protein
LRIEHAATDEIIRELFYGEREKGRPPHGAFAFKIPTDVRRVYWCAKEHHGDGGRKKKETVRYSITKIRNYFVSCAVILKIIDMALPIKRAPVLRGKAAREFHERWEQMLIRESRISDEERARRAEESRKWKEYFSKHKFL